MREKKTFKKKKDKDEKAAKKDKTLGKSKSDKSGNTSKSTDTSNSSNSVPAVLHDSVAPMQLSHNESDLTSSQGMIAQLISTFALNFQR